MKFKGFTLVEILIVVVILGILAAIILPKFSNASSAAKASMLADDLRIFRMQIAIFAGHHKVPPGYAGCDPSSAPMEAAFVSQMTMASDMDGHTAAPGTSGYPFGPYLREIPPNPINSKTTVQMIPNDGSMPASPDDSHGWVYQSSTMTFKADSQGADETGVFYYEY
jgi:general secretion pathway protein G